MLEKVLPLLVLLLKLQNCEVSADYVKNPHYTKLEYMGKVLHYRVNETKFTPEQREKIKQAVDAIQLNTCFKWEEMRDPLIDLIGRWVEFEPAENPRSCEMHGPSTDKQQRVYHIILAPHCFDDDWVVHYMMMVMGYYREHQRQDRDCYVAVDKSKWNDVGYIISDNVEMEFPYDMHSVMHFRRSPDIRPADDYPNPEESLGNKVLSEKDEWRINYDYCGGPHWCPTHVDECDKFYKEKDNCIQKSLATKAAEVKDWD